MCRSTNTQNYYDQLISSWCTWDCTAVWLHVYHEEINCTIFHCNFPVSFLLRWHQVKFLLKGNGFEVRCFTTVLQGKSNLVQYRNCEEKEEKGRRRTRDGRMVRNEQECWAAHPCCKTPVFSFRKGRLGRSVYLGLDRWSERVDARVSVWLGGVLTCLSGEDISYNAQWNSLAFIFVIYLSTIINALPHKILLNEYCLYSYRAFHYLYCWCITVHTAVWFWDTVYLYSLLFCSKSQQFLAVPPHFCIPSTMFS